MAVLVSTNPAKNYKKIASVKISSLDEIKIKVDLANKAKRLWKELGVDRRTKLLTPLYKIKKLRKEKKRLLC